MIYLIGGAPRVGKSRLATKLVAAKPMPFFSLDFLYNLEQVKQISGFKKAPILKKGRLFYPTLKELIVDVDRRSKDCVIEGEVVLPEFIPELSREYEIQSCFLGLSQTSIESIISHGGHFNWPLWKQENGRRNEVDGLAERTVSRSLEIQEEAYKYNLPYYDLAIDYDQKSKEALHSLLSLT